MTLPSPSQRIEAKAIMNHFRGDEGAAGQLACNNSATLVCDDLEQGSVVFREDLDRFVHLRHHESSASCAQSSREEDSYLPRGVPQLVLDLPDMLRTRSVTKATNHNENEQNHNHVWDSLEAKRSETLEQLVEHTTEYILPPSCSSSSSQHRNDRSKWSYGRFGLDTNNQADRNRLVLECLPVLRRIGILERSAEFLEEQQKQMAEKLSLNNDEEAADNSTSSSSLRRSTRRVVTRAAPKQRRQHYFDRLSVTLRRDEADLDTTAVGALFADQWQSGLVRPSLL
jgi:hypothetical protein